MNQYVAPIPSLVALQSNQHDSPAPAIQAGDLHQNAHILAATKQLQCREVMAIMNPELITDEEVVAAKRRLRQIERAQFDVVGPDGVAETVWVRLLLDRMNAIHQQQRREQQQQRREQQQQRREQHQQWREQHQQWREQQQQQHEQQQHEQQQHEQQQHEQQQREQQQREQQQHEQRLFQRLDQLLQESQRSRNRSIRTIEDSLTPVLRIEDGEYPAHFPQTLAELMNATGQQIDDLLQFYNLPHDRLVAERKDRLRKHLGCNI